MTARLRHLLLAFAGTGLVVAGASSWIHAQLIADPCYTSPCDINATFNCSSVYLSQFGSVGGVPVAIGGVFWFGLVALLAWFATPGAASKDDATGAYLFALSTIGLAVILYLGYASAVVLHRVCLLCLGTYACVIGIFITTVLVRSVPLPSLAGRFVSDVRALTRSSARSAAALVYVAVVAAALVLFPRVVAAGQAHCATGAPVAADRRLAFEQSWAAQPRIDLGVPADGAKVVIVKFNDWQCPSCKFASQAYAPVLKKYADSMPGAVKYVVKDFPWNPECNPRVPAMHSAACEAAAAVRMARDRGKDAEMEAWLFDHQETLTPNAVIEAVRTIAGVTDFAREYAQKLPEISHDVADGEALDVHSTPTYFINGTRFNLPDGSWLPAEYLDIVIQYELKKAGGK